MSLSPKRRRFVEEYAVDFNATRAALRAGYAERGASTQGQRLLQNAEVRQALDDILDQMSLTTAQIVGMLAGQAMGTIPTKATIERDTEGNVVKFREEYDSHSALDKLARARGVYDGEDTTVRRVLVVRDVVDVLAELEAGGE